MKTKFLWFLCVFCFTILPLSAQEKFTLSGTISEEKSNETLIELILSFQKYLPVQLPTSMASIP